MNTDDLLGHRSEPVVLVTERELRNLRTMASRVDEMQGRCSALKIECDDLRVQLREATVAADRLVNERDAARRELAERDEAEREAAERLPEAVRKIRDGSRAAGGFDPQLVDENVLDAADQIVRIVASAPATAIAAVLPATESDASVLREWQSDSRLCTPLRADELARWKRHVAAHPEPAEAGPLVEWLTSRIVRHDCDDRESAATVAREIAAHVEQAETERAALMAARRKIVDAMPMVEAVAEMVRAAYIRRKQVGPFAHVAAREIAAHVERSLPKVADLADRIRERSTEWSSVEWARVALDGVRISLGLDAAAPEREEPSEPEPCIRPAPWNGSQQPSDPEPASAWATLPEEVRSAVAEFASPSPRPCDGRIGDPDKVAAVLHRWKAERTEGDSRDPAELGHLLGMAIDCLVLPGHVITGEDWERACILSGRACEPFLSHDLDRPEPDAASVEDISAIIEAHVTGGVQRATTAAAARHIVARFGSPPTVPVLALPSMDEVDEAVRNEMRRAGSLQVGRIRNAVLDLVRERQPAAFRNALAKWRGLPKEHRGRFVEDRWLLVFADAEACRVASILLDTLDALEGE